MSKAPVRRAIRQWVAAEDLAIGLSSPYVTVLTADPPNNFAVNTQFIVKRILLWWTLLANASYVSDGTGFLTMGVCHLDVDAAGVLDAKDANQVDKRWVFRYRWPMVRVDTALGQTKSIMGALYQHAGARHWGFIDIPVYNGQGVTVKKDEALAMSWHADSAIAGDIDLQFSLQMLFQG